MCGECPGGDWQTHSIPAFSVFIAAGGAIATTTYTCKSNGLECQATSICFGGGPILAAGAGGDYGLTRNAIHARGLSGYSSGFYATAGPVSLLLHPDGGNAGVAKSIGGGLAWVSCTNLHIKCKCSSCGDDWIYLD